MTDSNLRTENIRQFFEQGTELRFSKGEIVHDSDTDSSMFFLRRGYVKSYMITDEGNYNTLCLYGPEYIFPLGPTLRKALGRSPYQLKDNVYFEAITNVKVYKRTRDELLTFADQEPIIYKEMIKSLLDNYEIYLSRVESSAYKLARQRVAHQLLVLSNRFASETYGEIILNIPLTHQDLAETLSMARETVSRELEVLRQNDIIDIKDKYFIIRDIDALQTAVFED